MNTLILGASGYAGSEIKQVLRRKAHHVFGTYHTYNPSYCEDTSMFSYELGDAEGLSHILRTVSPDIVISCLRGDFAQQIQAHKIAVDFLRNQEHSKLIFLSTANVFDGALETAHFEYDAPKSESEYGKFKIQCEEMIRAALQERGIIIRVPEIYGKNCPRLIQLQKAVQAQTPIRTFQNYFVNYTTNRQIAEWISYIIDNGLPGIFHIGTKDLSDYVAFQEKLIRRLRLGTPIFQVSTQPVALTQAVLPGRPEIPDSMQLCIADILNYLAEQ